MLENFFLTYANYPLRDNPENFHKIFEEIFSCIEEKQSLKKIYAKWLIESIIDLARFNDPKMAGEYRKKEKKARPIRDWIYDVAYEANYMYKKNFVKRNALKFMVLISPKYLEKVD